MAEPESQDLTQQATQHAYDPRRYGRNNSGLEDQDVSDVICILHPSSQAAYQIVENTASQNRQHILQNGFLAGNVRAESMTRASELETFVVTHVEIEQPKDLALRFSSHVCDPSLGFCFGRSPVKCDIILDPSDTQKRVSNIHFRIDYNHHGILMLEDTSTNGTVVDEVPLGRKRNPNNPCTRMLSNGSIIQILSPAQEEIIKFIVKIPDRQGYYDEYRSKFRNYMEHKAQVQRDRTADKYALPEVTAKGVLASPVLGMPNPKDIPVPEPLAQSQYGMKWDGGGYYKSTAVLGKGAFAVVYQVALTESGEVFAAKELEKKKFVRNGQMDTKLDNEMKIMQELRHDHIVQYIDYHETAHHLYIIMEYVPYGDVQGYILEHNTMPESMAQDMTRQIFSALEYLHQKNITHRDIKPDNILICSEQPFRVKLTDFGLSKVVKNNETFLKTFCGTLLYCAPEVFPHYDNYVASRRPKRRRREAARRSYSQLVDIWSYAAVLWFVLCSKPPFEGVMDPNGRAMFTKIMETPLDVRPLLEVGVSQDGIDLLRLMLTTDPMNRPSEQQLKFHPWLNHGKSMPEFAEEMDLFSIAEEELDASQLNINDNNDSKELRILEEEEQSSGECGGHPNAKRLRAVDFFIPPLQRQVSLAQGQHQDPPTPQKPDRLFGEISSNALKSSGLLGDGFKQIPDTTADQWSSESSHIHGSWESESSHRKSQHSYLGEKYDPPAAPSLFGAESMVRDLHMMSPNASTGDSGAENKHCTPQGPLLPHTQPESNVSDPASGTLDATPRPPVFSRQISLPIPGSGLFEIQDERTQEMQKENNQEVQNQRTQKIPTEGIQEMQNEKTQEMQGERTQEMQDGENTKGLGIDLNGDLRAPDLPSPNTTSIDRRISLQLHSLTDQTMAGALELDHLAPASESLLGRLVSTPDSLLSVNIALDRRITMWGRHPLNTHVYPHPEDIRVPKIALEIWFYSARHMGPDSGPSASSGTSKTDRDSSPAPAQSADSSSRSISNANTLYSAAEIASWPDAQACIRTQSRHGIWVNGVHLAATDAARKRCYGYLHDGDEISLRMAQDSKGADIVKFKVELFCGLGTLSRGRSSKFTVMKT